MHPAQLQTPVTCRSEAEASAIKELVKELESTASLEDLDLSGTEWDLVYSNSKGSSSGKIGPFVGRVKQVMQPATLRQNMRWVHTPANAGCRLV